MNELLYLKAGTWLDYTGTPWDFALQYKNAAIMDVFRWVEISDKSAIFILNKVTQAPLTYNREAYLLKCEFRNFFFF